ncbi:hypothetical protein [Amycolatopsis benzoatilytica]|uniref:hypothetical protein n=1 Tax=Amycolatopsis benzoatilytica TaxID=346045 RepID=UPI0003751D47|nr:hypothetical protein [Amycolatopsis benzoatilytica]
MSTIGDDRACPVLTSPDGLVRATGGPAGTLDRLEIAPDAFERTTPGQLALTVQDLVRRLAEEPAPTLQQMPAPRPTPRRVRPRGTVPLNRRRGS